MRGIVNICHALLKRLKNFGVPLLALITIFHHNFMELATLSGSLITTNESNMESRLVNLF